MYLMVSMIEAGWLTYTSPDVVIRALEEAGKLRGVHKADADPRHWRVDVRTVRAALPAARFDEALLQEMEERDELEGRAVDAGELRRLRRDTDRRLRRIERRLHRL